MVKIFFILVSHMSNSDTMQKRFEDFVRLHTLIQPGASIVLAVSGGIDSMVMLDLFQRIRSPW